MSLLLDALKAAESTDPEASRSSAHPEPVESDEEPLDAFATLELLTPKAQPKPAPALVLELSTELTQDADPAPVAALHHTPPTPASAAAPAAVPARPSATPNATTSRAAGAPLGTPASARAAAATPGSRRHAKLIIAAAVLAGVGILAKSLWWPGTPDVIYPATNEAPPTPVASTDLPTPPTATVEVAASRPADQFAFTGNAPEIDLQASAASTAPKAPHHAAAPVTAVKPLKPAPPPDLSITRTEGSSLLDGHVQAGYQALNAGRLEDARTEYQAALTLDPHNIDALMGLGSVAAHQGRTQAAADAYAQVLKAEPGNPDATAAIAMLAGPSTAGEITESRLKVLIAGGNGGPALHAALGGVYAADSRWSDAAQEYFTALSNDPGNPDLAFDVAASLDQNRNPGMALTYYRQALAFARQRPAQMDRHAVELRIAQLSARLEGKTADGKAP